VAAIYVESKPIGAFGYDHLYLVYQDDDGQEFVIRGGPLTDNPLDFGNIEIDNNLLLELSEDARDGVTPLDRGQVELDLQGGDPSAVWDEMSRNAEFLSLANVDYEALINATNSNSVIDWVLRQSGLDIRDNMPSNTSLEDLPGIGEPYLDVLDWFQNITGLDDFFGSFNEFVDSLYFGICSNQDKNSALFDE